MDDLNYYVLLVFAPLLLATGLLGFVIPADKSITSGTPAYNVFHVAFGLLGLAVLLSCHGQCIRWFNIGFGAIDLYQAVAGRLNWFPAAHFKWKTADDVLHVVIGCFLVLIGLFAQ